MVAVTDFFDRGWRNSPEAIAYVDDRRSWTFEEAGTRSYAIAHRLLASGLPRGAKVAVISPNDPDAWIVVMAIWRAGLAWVPLNPAMSAPALTELVEAFDCEAVFFHSSLAGKTDIVVEESPRVRLVVAVDQQVGERPELAAWIAGAPSTDPQVDHQPDDVVAIFPTGGTTGRPKGVMNTHRSFSTAFAHIMMAFHYESTEPIINLVAAPLTHTAGMLTLPVSARGGTVAVIERAEPVAVLDAIERYGVTELFLPPTVIYRLLETPGLESRNLRSLRYLLYGSAPMSSEKLTRALEVFGPVMMEGYGQVEAFSGISFLRPEEHYRDGRVRDDDRLVSCGRPYPLIRVEIRDGDRTLEPGETGEICVHGDLVMRGYYGQPEETARAVRDGWLYTGDIGHLDESGYLYITDRAKDVIITGGLNVYPSEVEQVLWSHPSVQECAVVGAPHHDWGEQVVAVVEPVPGALIDGEELVQLCKQRLGSYKAPKRVDVVAQIPRSVNGKVVKKEVRESYWRDHARRI